MVLILSLCSAVTYGLSDFVGGFATRRASVWIIAATSQGVAALLTIGLAATNPGDPTSRDFVWAVVAGLGSGAGNVLLYEGLARGRMMVVAPIASLSTAAVPVIVGFATGDRPGTLAIIGVLIALPSIWLVSNPGAALRDARGSDLRFGLAAGLAFGIQFSALGQIPSHAGLTPLAVSQVISVLSIMTAATLVRSTWIPRDRTALMGALAGALAAIATACFQLAVQRGMLMIAAVVASLYPATTVLLSYFILKERIYPVQSIGLGLALLTVVLIAIG